MAMTPAQDQAFTDHLRPKALEAEKKHRYRPTQFLQMLGSLGGYATAVQLLGSKDISEGFKTLWRHNRLDLTVEALVISPAPPAPSRRMMVLLRAPRCAPFSSPRSTPI